MNLLLYYSFALFLPQGFLRAYSRVYAHRIVGFVKMCDEGQNIERCLDNMKTFCDEIAVYDDGSSDNSVEIASRYSRHIILADHNDFEGELFAKQLLLDQVLRLEPDWIFWLDADEVVQEDATMRIRELCALGDLAGIDAFDFHEINLWNSESTCRIDSLYDQGWFRRLWRNNGRLHFRPARGVHKEQFPQNLSVVQKCEVKVIHYGFLRREDRLRKYRRYASLGQSGFMLERLVDESGLRLRNVDPEWIPSAS
jgi:glycosyltransferase involved in cell wall biosynthesis